ncbi:PQQ-binding-like beta-propeller repeat protein [Myxococcus sp. RHSTA-1-4]|uniref:PQQ-binding-like beta-propeller repeat protein n=1 Tax=Myxococcus sp. RHSTA-1-4 TaxID=2874601 RepID=UPI001CBC69D1|nr:PQQ-binding-like beta-propeller repeat protein [Myxococcus sp. RHSTA-1-4]MBZ4417275.1 PQQ-binding-like beta-propeller repeat protein [Myxococcus sp. RHSTA-1-4]
MKRLMGCAVVAVGVLFACTVPEWNPEDRDCDAQSRCIEGYTCVAGMCRRNGEPLPGTATLTMELLPGPSTPDGGADFRYTDPLRPDARHRDEEVVVRVRASQALPDAGPLSVALKGVEGPESSHLRVGDCDAGPFCKEVTFGLWSPPLRAFRGEFTATASIRDSEGNTLTASTSIPVTRWKWSFAGKAGVIQTSPAIGAGGTVYFGTGGAEGRVFALAPEGVVRWSRVVGRVTSGPAVGAFVNGRERVYVSVDASAVHSTHTKVLVALSSEGALPIYGCSRQAEDSYATPLVLTTTRMSTDPADVETVVTQVELPKVGTEHAAQLVAFRPDDTGTNPCMEPIPSTDDSPPVFGGMVAHGLDVYATGYPGIQGFRFIADGWVKVPSATSNMPWEMSGLALSRNATHVVTAGADFDDSQSAVMRTLTNAGNPDAGVEYVAARGEPPIRDLVLGAADGGETLYFGHDAEDGALTAVGLVDMARLRSVPGAGVIPNAPVLGAAGVLYTASGPQSRGAEVSAWEASTLKLLWRLSDSVAPVAGWQSSSTVFSSPSPALDCARARSGSARDEELGTLYVPGADGVLYAIIVDSRGLDTNAPWPRFQHDARNTGNAATPLACP